MFWNFYLHHRGHLFLAFMYIVSSFIKFQYLSEELRHRPLDSGVLGSGLYAAWSCRGYLSSKHGYTAVTLSHTVSATMDFPPLDQLLDTLWKSEDNRSYMKKYLTTELARKLSSRKTASGCDLASIVVSGKLSLVWIDNWFNFYLVVWKIQCTIHYNSILL